MIVGMAISQLVESASSVMKFDLEEAESERAKWYLALVRAKDSIGSLEPLRTQNAGNRMSKKNSRKKLSSRLPPQDHAKASSHASKVISIEEITDDTEKEDDDLIPHEKPDTDASDSDDDPTLVRRSKPTAPV
jgi:telomere length regulation protein